MNTINFYVVARILMGCFFIINGVDKLVQPYQNFLYIVQSYSFLPPILEELTARVVPWAEFLLGVFMVLGLWLDKVLRLQLLLMTLFIVTIAQALIRRIPLEECGCFGDLIKVPPQVTIGFDFILLIFVVMMINKIKKTSCFSMDEQFK